MLSDSRWGLWVYIFYGTSRVSTWTPGDRGFVDWLDDTGSPGSLESSIFVWRTWGKGGLRFKSCTGGLGDRRPSFRFPGMSVRIPWEVGVTPVPVTDCRSRVTRGTVRGGTSPSVSGGWTQTCRRDTPSTTSLSTIVWGSLLLSSLPLLFLVLS